MAKLNSAVVTVLPPGVFITTMPCCVAASMSTLSTPTPARPTTRNFFAASMTLLGHFGFGADDQRRGVGHDGQQFRLGQTFGQHDDFKFGTLLEQRDAFGRDRVANDDFHNIKWNGEFRHVAGRGQIANPCQNSLCAGQKTGYVSSAK